MESIILYGSYQKLTTFHREVMSNKGNAIYVRAVESGDDIDGALSTAKPMVGEFVLNTIPMPGKDIAR